MGLLLEIIHTENTLIPVLEMTMAQCPGDTGMMHKFKLIPLGQTLTESIYNLVTVTAMVEAGSPETTWTVQVVAHTETHTMVTVRYVFISVVATEDNCGKKKSYKNNQPNQCNDNCSLQSGNVGVFDPSAEEIACQAAALTPLHIPSLNSWKFIIHKYLNIGSLMKKLKFHQQMIKAHYIIALCKPVLWQRHLTQNVSPREFETVWNPISPWKHLSATQFVVPSKALPQGVTF